MGGNPRVLALPQAAHALPLMLLSECVLYLLPLLVLCLPVTSTSPSSHSLSFSPSRKTQSGDTSRDVHEKARDAFYRWPALRPNPINRMLA